LQIDNSEKVDESVEVAENNFDANGKLNLDSLLDNKLKEDQTKLAMQ
jgi:hypothetical protein